MIILKKLYGGINIIEEKVTPKLLEHYEDDRRLMIRKYLHKNFSTNNVDTQYEAISRIGNAKSVLDIGCGSADLLIKLRTIGYRGKLKGIDNYNIIEVGRKYIQEKGLDIELERIDVANQIEQGNWDVGVMVSILCQTPDYINIIKQYSKICNKLIILDVASGAYPRLNKRYIRDVEQKFDVLASTRENGYNMQNTITELMKYYETINYQRLDDAFRFETSDGAANYFDSNGAGGWIPKPTPQKWNDIIDFIRSSAQKDIDRDGIFLEPKPYHVITAENPMKNIIPFETYIHHCDGSKY